MSTLAPNANGIKQGDTEPLTAILSDEEGPVNLAGADVTFRMSSRVAGAGHAPISGDCLVVQSTDGNGRIIDRGKVQYVWGVGETDVAGIYGVEFAVRFPDGKQRTFPSDRTVTFEIIAAAA